MLVAFLFDNDGVLIDSSEWHWQSWVQLMQEEHAFNMTHEQFTKGFGKRNDLIIKELLPDVSEKKQLALAQRKEELFRACARNKVKPLPGIETFLKEILASQIPHIIASSTPTKNLEMYLCSTALGNYFEHYLSAEEVEHGKPAPDIFVTAAQRLGFDPSDCIVVEDAPAGIEAGKAAGAFVIALETTHTRTTLCDYDLIYQNPSELKLQDVLKAFDLWKRR